MKNVALILLGGKGKRLGNDVPKQFLTKNDIPIYIYAVNTYQQTRLITDILLVVHKDYIDQVKSDVKKYELDKVIDVIPGGNERFISSFYGLSKLMNYFGPNDNVLIADGVRPNVSEQIILANIFGLMEAKAILTAIRGKEEDERINTAHYRGGVCLLAQTPQSFKLGYIYNLYNRFINNDDFSPTDDINLVEMAHEDYDVVEGEISNYKITNPIDLEKFLKE